MSGCNKKEINWAILFLYYEESLISSNLNSKLFRFHGVRPNVHYCSKSLAKKLRVRKKLILWPTNPAAVVSAPPGGQLHTRREIARLSQRSHGTTKPVCCKKSQKSPNQETMGPLDTLRSLINGYTRLLFFIKKSSLPALIWVYPFTKICKKILLPRLFEPTRLFVLGEIPNSTIK
jgi:hypothetical protein